MTAEQWIEKGRAEAAVEAEDVTLPSGMVIRARRPSPLQLALWGSLPLELVDAPADAHVSNAAIVKMMQASHDLLEYCVVAPRISLGGEPGTVHPRQVPNADLMYILSWARRGEQIDALQDFRSQSGVPGAGVDGEDVRDAAERATRDYRSGGGAGARPGGDDAGSHSGIRVREMA